MTPLTEIGKDCRIDSKKEKYEEKNLNCFENASLISKLAKFSDQIQIVNRGPKILKSLIDLNPSTSEIVERTEAKTTAWAMGTQC